METNEKIIKVEFVDMTDYSPFVFENISQYGNFKDALNRVNMLEEFIEFHSKNYLSGFYDGQWSLLPETTGTDIELLAGRAVTDDGEKF